MTLHGFNLYSSILSWKILWNVPDTKWKVFERRKAVIALFPWIAGEARGERILPVMKLSLWKLHRCWMVMQMLFSLEYLAQSTQHLGVIFVWSGFYKVSSNISDYLKCKLFLVIQVIFLNWHSLDQVWWNSFTPTFYHVRLSCSLKMVSITIR